MLCFKPRQNELNCAKKEISELKESVRTHVIKEMEYERKIEELEKSLHEERIKSDRIQWELDLIYQQYDLTKEPSQEVKTQVRIDKRVHELELENAELRATLRALALPNTTVLSANGKPISYIFGPNGIC